MLLAAKLLISIALVFAALGLVSAVWVSRPRQTKSEVASGRAPARRHFGSVPQVKPAFGRCANEASLTRAGRRADDAGVTRAGHSPGFGRAELEAITARAAARAATDPMGLGRPLHFRECTGEFAAGAADGGHSVPTEVLAIRTFRLIELRPRRCSASREALRDEASLRTGGRDV